MTFLDHFFLPSVQILGPAALAVSAILTTAVLARSRRSHATATRIVQRRLGLPKGVTRWVIIGGLTIMALLAFGIDLQGLWSTLVAALSLVAIGFVAMWSILSHMLASILIVIFRPFEVGDWIEIVGDDPVVGEVTDLNPVYTTLATGDGGTLQVPNNLFFQKAVKRRGSAAASAVLHPNVAATSRSDETEEVVDPRTGFPSFASAPGQSFGASTAPAPEAAAAVRRRG